MKRIIVLSLVVMVSVFIVSCASSTPGLIRFPTESGATLYFFPMMDWTAKKNAIKATVDITYRHEPGSEAVCNITFTNTAKEKAVPSVPVSAFFSGDDGNYPLSDIDILFTDAAKKASRITSHTAGENIIPLVKSQSVSLVAIIDGIEYRFIAPPNFFKYRDTVLTAIGITAKK